jgi:hypothetical protein
MTGMADEGVSDLASDDPSVPASDDTSDSTSVAEGAASKPKGDRPRRRPKKIIHLEGFTMEDILAHMRQVYSEGVR